MVLVGIVERVILTTGVTVAVVVVAVFVSVVVIVNDALRVGYVVLGVVVVGRARSFVAVAEIGVIAVVDVPVMAGAEVVLRYLIPFFLSDPPSQKRPDPFCRVGCSLEKPQPVT